MFYHFVHIFNPMSFVEIGDSQACLRDMEWF